MKFLAQIIDSLGRLKFWKFITLVLLGAMFFLSYLFKEDIEHRFNTYILNDDRIASVIDNDYLIQVELEQAMNAMNSDRAYIFRFHNGVRYYNGTHKNKMSCEYEVARAGISLEAERLQDIPVTLFPYFIIETMKEGMFFDDTDNIKDTRTRMTLQAQGITGIITYPYYKDDVLVAIVGFDYVTTEVVISEKCKVFVDRLTQNIGDLLI